MSLPSGRYVITSLLSNNAVRLLSGADGTPLTVNANDGSTKFQWQITLLDNSLYTILNRSFPKHAFAQASAGPGDQVVGSTQVRQWRINNIGDNIYTIQSIDTGLFWTVASAEPEASVILGEDQGNNRTRFRIEQVVGKDAD